MRGKPKTAQNRTNQCVLTFPVIENHIILYVYDGSKIIKHVPLFHSKGPLLLQHPGPHLPRLLRNIKAPASSTSTPPPRTKPATSSKGKKEKEGKEKIRSPEDGEPKPKKARKSK